jgi:hypothetical protein
MDTTNNNRHIQDKPISVNKISASSRRSPSPSNETKINNKKVRPSGNNDVREWDLPKLQQEKDKSPIERHVIEEPIGNSINNKIKSFFFILILVKSNEPPAKGLDDYFRKTKAKPAVYWLPLTEEQVRSGISFLIIFMFSEFRFLNELVDKNNVMLNVMKNRENANLMKILVHQTAIKIP